MVLTLLISDIRIPHQKVIALGREDQFICRNADQFEDISQFQWLVNGTLVEEANPEDEIYVDNGDHLGHIHFINVPVDYNNTIAQCRVTFASDGNITYSNIGTLLVQGEDCK